LPIFTTEVLIATETTEIFINFSSVAISGNQCLSGFFATIYHNIAANIAVDPAGQSCHARAA